MALVDDLKTISSDLDTLKAVVEGVVTSLDASAEPSLGDKVLEAVVPVLEAAGYSAPAETLTEESSTEETSTGEEPDAATNTDGSAADSSSAPA